MLLVLLAAVNPPPACREMRVCKIPAPSANRCRSPSADTGAFRRSRSTFWLDAEAPSLLAKCQKLDGSGEYGEKVTLSLHPPGGGATAQQCARRISEVGSVTTGQVDDSGQVCPSSPTQGRLTSRSALVAFVPCRYTQLRLNSRYGPSESNDHPARSWHEGSRVVWTRLTVMVGASYCALKGNVSNMMSALGRTVKCQMYMRRRR